MKKEVRKIIKFSVGRFTNGISLFFGVMWYGKFFGVTLRNYFPHIVINKRFVFYNQYLSEDDVMSFIRKVRPFYYYYFYSNIDDVIAFLFEVLNLKLCAWKYDSFIGQIDRRVLIEKKTEKSIYKNYKHYNEEKEFELIKIIAKKYRKKIVNDVYVGNRKEHCADIYSNICTVWVPSVFNGEVYIEFSISDYLEPIVQHYIDAKSERNSQIITEILS